MEKHTNFLTVPVCTLSIRYEVFGQPGQVSTPFTTLLACIE